MLEATQPSEMIVNVRSHRVQEGRGDWKIQGKAPEREESHAEKERQTPTQESP